jgi:hypothetical protein
MSVCEKAENGKSAHIIKKMMKIGFIPDFITTSRIFGVSILHLRRKNVYYTCLNTPDIQQ